METLVVEREGPVAVIRLNRPPVNAVTRQMMSELRDCFTGLAEDRDVNCIVLSAAGTKAFCAGIDLAEASRAATGQRSVADTLDPGRYWRETQRCIHQCPVPVIAAVDRAAIGAGFGLVGVCDLIVASETATFALTEINVGLLGGAAKALRMLGPFKARMMLFSGESLTASDLYRVGAVEIVVPAGPQNVRPWCWPGGSLPRARSPSDWRRSQYSGSKEALWRTPTGQSRTTRSA